MSDDSVKQRSLGRAVMDGLGSYWLSCLCLFVLFLLTIFGTLYQRENGLYAAQERYFNSWFLWMHFGDTAVPFAPSGVLAMSVLAVNLVVGGLVRLQIGARTLGVLVIHLGIAFLLIASLVKLRSSDEGHLQLFEGEQSGHFTSYYDWEVAVWRVDGMPGGAAEEAVVDNQFLTDLVDGRKRTFTLPGVPFELELSNYLPNCDPLPKGPNWTAASPVVDGYALLERSPAKQAEANSAGLFARALVDGKAQESILWGGPSLPWTLEAGGHTWAVALRHTRFPMPFEIRLDDFQKEDHPGTGLAKSYRSYVYKVEGDGEERILIQMNEPLRSEGLVLFQSSWGPQNARPGEPLFSGFSVVRNPSDKWPEIALWVITAGMAYDFGSKLLRFLIRMTRQGAARAGGAA
ncbi:MAG: cytochrome c biogenesis protein ResB [Planctomycetes bacterium]|nr:cytochrome c biogenesis protein ResB [Planctomycetota bacterium]